MSITKKILLSLTVIVTVALGTAYFLGMAYFQTHYKIGTVINGFKCSMNTVNEAELLLNRNGESYAIEIDTRNNGVEEISSEEVGLAFTGQDELKNILRKQDFYLWFLPVTEEITLPVDAYQIDKTKLEKACANLSCMQNMVKAQTAQVIEIDNFYQVLPAVRGNELDVNKTIDVIGTALRQWRPKVDLEETACYIDTDAGDEEMLQKNCDLLNSIQDTIITYDFGDRKEVVDFSVIKEKFIASDGSIDLEKVKAYLEEIAQIYDTVGAERTFITYDDRTIPISGGDYGWTMNINATANELVELIKANTIDVVEPIYTYAAVSRDKNDIGRSYLEIDTENEQAILYVDGVPVVQTDVYLGHGIEQGFYSMRGKEDSHILFGSGYVYAYEKTDASNFSDTDEIIGVSSIGITEGCIAVVNVNDMEIIYETMGDWPIIIY